MKALIPSRGTHSAIVTGPAKRESVRGPNAQLFRFPGPPRNKDSVWVVNKAFHSQSRLSVSFPHPLHARERVNISSLEGLFQISTTPPSSHDKKGREGPADSYRKLVRISDGLIRQECSGENPAGNLLCTASLSSHFLMHLGASRCAPSWWRIVLAIIPTTAANSIGLRDGGISR
ncbi:hypothetical protein MRX96_026924 [Rhipicephalus microplus]